MTKVKDKTNHAGSAEGCCSKARAIEIASLNEFGAYEFCELTGVSIGSYGIYEIDQKGVRIRLQTSDIFWTTRQNIEIRNATKGTSLDFPCTPDDFASWYDRTRGENGIRDIGVSDFPLADNFFEAIGRKPPVLRTVASGVPPVPSSKIIEAFEVKSNLTENQKWWDDRMRSAKRYGLETARASLGRGGRNCPSYWHPLSVGIWLMDRGHLHDSAVIHAIKKYFPDCNVDYLTDD